MPSFNIPLRMGGLGRGAPTLSDWIEHDAFICWSATAAEAPTLRIIRQPSEATMTVFAVFLRHFHFGAQLDAMARLPSSEMRITRCSDRALYLSNDEIL